jgi:patatin-like phospholipase/acyl hydrolase
LVTAYDMQRRRTYFFTQYNARTDRQRDFLARDVALATSAAPTFFEVAHIQSLTGEYSSFIDGGVFASNPAMCAYVEAQRFRGHPMAKQMLLLSLGTGQVTTPYDFKRIQHWGIFDWLKPLLDMFMTGVSETVDFQLRQIFAAAGVPHQYLRMNPFLDGSCSPELDNATPENLKNLQIAAQGAARDQARDLGRFADLLVRIGPRVVPPRFLSTRHRTT